jgi:hypothetical protein
MGHEKWSTFVEDYYKWYLKMDQGRRDNFLDAIDLELYLNWHLNIVRQNTRLDLMYWSDRVKERPTFYDDAHSTISELELKEPIYRFTGPDGHLAAFQRVFFVHGLEAFRVIHSKLVT